MKWLHHFWKMYPLPCPFGKIDPSELKICTDCCVEIEIFALFSI